MKFIAKTLFGLEELLAGEIASTSALNVSVRNRAVLFEGDLKTLYEVSYTSRTALSVLMEAGSFSLQKASDLYDMALKIEWDSIMSSDDTFAVVSVVNSPLFSHTAYPGLVVKDAVADYFRKRVGRRPSVDTSHPGILINLHISNRDATISFDSSIVPLYKRGYRKMHGMAPLNESLAAGIIMLSGWKGDSTFHDPMCGSGTIPVEAGLIAARIPSGYFREFFGFQNWKNYDEALFSAIRNRYNSLIRTITVSISGGDISHQAVKQARDTIAGAGLGGEVRIFREDFVAEDSRKREGLLLFNPPYGKRVNPGDLSNLYSRIGSMLKHRHTGVEAWILSGAPEALKSVALKPSARYKLYNGSIECQLNGYITREGSFRGAK
ncbi:MAG: THUMP domain-containing protein [Bacteroidales bacterium]